jgi:oligopeptide/dipeptide ABC transporter ATP-binding protein
MAAALLSLDRLECIFSTINGPSRVLRGVSLEVQAGERVAIVGESGCGKSVTARAILGLLPPRATRLTGAIRFDGRDLLGLPPFKMRELRGRAITMIFQDPMAALNPMFTIRDQFREVVQRGVRHTAGTAEAAMRAALAEVAIADPARVLDSYSFQLSGGLNQRVMIAMALVNQPKVVIADEPGTALDVTVQEQTLRLMRRLSEQHATAILFISHNLGVVRTFAHRVAVMYAGRIVEQAPTGELFARPRHPYTRALLAAVPRLAVATLPRGIDGEVPDFHSEIPGCSFRPRCERAHPGCIAPVPTREAASGHFVACIDAAALAP